MENLQIKSIALNAACVQKAGLQGVTAGEILKIAKEFEKFLKNEGK